MGKYNSWILSEYGWGSLWRLTSHICYRDKGSDLRDKGSDLRDKGSDLRDKGSDLRDKKSDHIQLNILIFE